jgi:hypothetical protein
MFTGLKDYEYLMQMKLYIPNVNSDISCQLGSHIPAHEYKVSVMSATVQKIFNFVAIRILPSITTCYSKYLNHSFTFFECIKLHRLNKLYEAHVHKYDPMGGKKTL